MIPAEYVIRARFGDFLGVPNWVDITTWYDSEGGALQITRGRQNEADKPSPSRLTVPLINDDGRFTPGRAASPYWPHVRDGIEIEVTAIVATTQNLEDNASVEYGIAEWVGTSATPPALTASTARVYPDGGVWSLLITWQPTAGDGAAQRLVRGFRVGQRYTVSRRVWVPAGSPDVRVRVNGGFTASGTPTAVKDTWTTVSVTFTAVNTSHFVDIYVAASPSGGQCWVDAGQTEAGDVVTAPAASAALVPRFFGYALEWPTSWGSGPAQAAGAQLVALGITDRLDQRFGDLASFTIEERLLDNPVTLLALDEPAEATQAGNRGSDPRPGQLVNRGGGGVAEFGAGTGPAADGSASLVLTRASATSGWYVRVPSPYLSTAITVEAFIATAQAECLILNPTNSMPGDPYYGWGLALKITSLGKLEWRSDVNLIVTSAATVTDGRTHHVAATYVHTGTQHVATLYLDGVAIESGAVASTVQFIGGQWLLVGGSGKLDLFSGTINHAALYNTALPADRIAAHAAAGLTGFGGEAAHDRISRIAAYANLRALTPQARTGVWVLDSPAASVLGSTTVLAATDLDVDQGSARVWGQAGGGFTPLAGMQDVADTEGGLVLEDRLGFLDFHGRTRRYNRPPTVRLDLADVEVTPEFAYDPGDVVNDATVTTQDGAAVRRVDQASVDARGTYSGSAQVLTRDAADAFSAASWRVSRFGEPRPRYPSVTVDLTEATPDVALRVLRTDVSDRLDLEGLPAQAPAPVAALFVEGYTETVSDGELSVAFNTTSADGYQVWVLDNPVLSVLDSTTVLAW